MVIAGIHRLYNSSVLWFWAMNGFRLGAAFLLLPLLMDKLPTAEFGMYQGVFLGLMGFLPVLDFGFSVSIGRYVSYGMAGAKEFQAMGVTTSEKGEGPNYPLLWELLETTRRLYRYLSLAALILMGTVGTWAVGLRVEETTSPSSTWIAWGVALLSAVLEIYAGWWNTFLRGMNQVLLSARISVLAYAVRLVLACALLFGEAGLLAIPLAGLVSSFLHRQLSRRACLKRLRRPSEPMPSRPRALLWTLWPNSWRAGLQFLSGYLATDVNRLICMAVLGLKVTEVYGLSLQVAMLIGGMSSVWTLVKWPLVGQYRARGDDDGLRRLLWSRMWLQSATFVVLAAGAWVLGPILLEWHGSGKELLPPGLFLVMLLAAFLDMQFSFWTTLLSTENRIPSLWPSVITNLTSVLIVVVVMHTSNLGVAVLVLVPFSLGCLFNYWYWPVLGAQSLKSSFLGFAFGGGSAGTR